MQHAFQEPHPDVAKVISEATGITTMRKYLHGFAEETAVLAKNKNRPFISGANGVFASQLCEEDADVDVLREKLLLIRDQAKENYHNEFEDDQAWRDFTAMLERQSVGREAIASIVNDVLKKFLLTLHWSHENGRAHYTSCLSIQRLYFDSTEIGTKTLIDKKSVLDDFAFYVQCLAHVYGMWVQENVASRAFTAMYLDVYMQIEIKGNGSILPIPKNQIQ